MKNLKLLVSIAIIAILFAVSACKKSNTSPCENQVDDTKTNIRIKNTSAYNFEGFYLNPNGTTKSYNTIASGETSCYHNFEKAYSYAHVKMQVNGEDFEIFPIDYVGEEELGTGKFTYSIDIVDPATKQIKITATPD